ncbi:hypothetical protein CJO80_16725 [Ralstonia solanacearum]|nr:hypothetical protein CJO80_16725 [Ralstonia solanacearum]
MRHYGKERDLDVRRQGGVRKIASDKTRRESVADTLKLCGIVIPIGPEAFAEPLHITRKCGISGQSVPCLRVAVEKEHLREELHEPFADLRVHCSQPTKGPAAARNEDGLSEWRRDEDWKNAMQRYTDFELAVHPASG